MKNVCLILGLVIMSLSGCSNNTSPKTISTPQSLQSLSITTNTGTNTNTVSNPSTEENNSQPNDSNQQTETTNSTEKTFATQQDFVDYMYEKVKALEDTISLLDSNLTQVYSVAGTEAETAQLSIRHNLLKDYVVKAYHYNVEYKKAEYEVFKAETLQDRQVLLDANAENEKLAQQYISLAWSEIDRLSETAYDRK
mgnify:CR=1 FL=1